MTNVRTFKNKVNLEMTLEIVKGFDGSAIETLWEEIGYTPKEMQAEQRRLNDLVIDAILIYQEELGYAHQHLKERLETLTIDFAQLMRAFGVKEQEILAKISDRKSVV
jgi:hypothetical protein